MRKRVTVSMLGFVLAACSLEAGARAPALVPWPKAVSMSAGNLMLAPGNRVTAASSELAPLAGVFADEFDAVFGIRLGTQRDHRGAGSILLRLNPTMKGEGYLLTVTRERAVVEGADYAAVAAGTVTLLQAAVGETPERVSIPCMSVHDEPFVPYRGLLVDVARREHSLDSLKQMVVLCRLYKIRYLQLHLFDDQGIKFPSSRFPLLTTMNHSGRAYTLDELRELEHYSQDRGVTIIPELEIPGHEGAMNRAMPDLFLIRGTKPYEHHATINWAKPEVMEALDVLIGEICAVFQATPYFHIGGDEADFTLAHQNADFIRRFKELGYEEPHDAQDTYQLYRRLLRDLDELLRTKYDRQMLCWEGFHRDLSPAPLEPIPKHIPVMAFENRYYRADHLAADGYTVINTAWNPLYVVNDLHCTPEQIYSWNLYRFGCFQPDWEKITWVSVPETTPILGAQMCSWEQPQTIELSSLRKRLPAMSERIWNPKAGKSVEDFLARLDQTDALLNRLVGSVETPRAARNVAGVYNNPNHDLGDNVCANMTNDTCFGWQTGNCVIPVHNNGHTFTLDSGNGNNLHYTGTLTGTGDVHILMGPWSDPPTWTTHNPLRLGGTQPNTFSGTCYVKKGCLQLEKPRGVTALGCRLVVGGQGSNDGVVWAADDQLSNQADIVLLTSPRGGAYLNLNGHNETVASLTIVSGTRVLTEARDGTPGCLRAGSVLLDGNLLANGKYTSKENWIEGNGTVYVGPVE